MLATEVHHCFLVGCDVHGCSVFYIPFDPVWCITMICIIGSIASQQAEKPDQIAGHKEFVEYTRERCGALQALCTIKSEKGAEVTRFSN